MKYVRIAIIVFLVASLGLYALGTFREIRNEDPTQPTITSDREVLELSVNYEEGDLLEGLSAYDDRDGDLTSEIMVGEFSQFVEKGVCNVSYVVFDSSNQPASLTRQVQFTDYESPKFTLSEPLVFSAGQTDNALSRIGATDVLDGNISADVKQQDSTIVYRDEGDYTISVEVSNSLGDVEEQVLPAHVVEPSRLALDIQLSQWILYLRVGDDFDPDEYVESLESTYGEAYSTGLVQADSQVDTDQPGWYEVHYTAETESGLTGETWMIVIVRE